MTDRIIIAIGGGELKTKATSQIDGYIASIVKQRTQGRRPNGLFIGTASHDSMPYFNSFRKTYTSDFDIKADCALVCYNEMSMGKIADKIRKADFIYVGGGDTVFMLNKWKETGILDLISEAYNKGTILCGLSAGAICWFSDMYTDSQIVNSNGEYSFHEGIGVIKGGCCPHYDERVLDFDKAFLDSDYDDFYCIENLSALLFVNETLIGSIGGGGASYLVRKNNRSIEKYEIKNLR